MSDTITKAPLKMKLTLKKETLRIIDDSQLDNVVGGYIADNLEDCGCTCGSTGCNSTVAGIAAR